MYNHKLIAVKRINDENSNRLLDVNKMKRIKNGGRKLQSISQDLASK